MNNEIIYQDVHRIFTKNHVYDIQMKPNSNGIVDYRIVRDSEFIINVGYLK